MQKNRKKYRTVKAVGPGHTAELTDELTYESEIIGSFRSLKTSGEPKKLPMVHFMHSTMISRKKRVNFHSKSSVLDY